MICESFNCLPSEALGEDPQMVIAILEARLASQAKDQFNQDASKLTGGAAALWAEMNFELQKQGYLKGK